MNTTREINDYINQKVNNRALLITGKWGCGKTYLIREIIKQLNDGDNHLGVCISLFGVDTIADFHTKTKEAILNGIGFDQAPGRLKQGARTI